MKIIITILTSSNSIFNNQNLQLFNHISSNIIKDYYLNNIKINIYILFNNNFIYYIIKLNNSYYISKLNSNFININIDLS